MWVKVRVGQNIGLGLDYNEGDNNKFYYIEDTFYSDDLDEFEDGRHRYVYLIVDVKIENDNSIKDLESIED